MSELDLNELENALGKEAFSKVNKEEAVVEETTEETKADPEQARAEARGWTDNKEEFEKAHPGKRWKSYQEFNRFEDNFDLVKQQQQKIDRQERILQNITKRLEKLTKGETEQQKEQLREHVQYQINMGHDPSEVLDNYEKDLRHIEEIEQTSPEFDIPEPLDPVRQEFVNRYRPVFDKLPPAKAAALRAGIEALDVEISNTKRAKAEKEPEHADEILDLGTHLKDLEQAMLREFGEVLGTKQKPKTKSVESSNQATQITTKRVDLDREDKEMLDFFVSKGLKKDTLIKSLGIED